MRYIVECQDGVRRHFDPPFFPNKEQAEGWTDWGHACLPPSTHLIIPLCDLCDEPMDGRGDGEAEMYDPAALPNPAVHCHASCGLAKGMVTA